MKDEVERLALTMMLTTYVYSPRIKKAEVILDIVKSAKDFVEGKLWMRYDPDNGYIACKTVAVREEE